METYKDREEWMVERISEWVIKIKIHDGARSVKGAGSSISVLLFVSKWARGAWYLWNRWDLVRKTEWMRYFHSLPSTIPAIRTGRRRGSSRYDTSSVNSLYPLIASIFSYALTHTFHRYSLGCFYFSEVQSNPKKCPTNVMVHSKSTITSKPRCEPNQTFVIDRLFRHMLDWRREMLDHTVRWIITRRDLQRGEMKFWRILPRMVNALPWMGVDVAYIIQLVTITLCREGGGKCQTMCKY